MYDRLGRCPSPRPSLRRLALVLCAAVSGGTFAAITTANERGAAHPPTSLIARADAAAVSGAERDESQLARILDALDPVALDRPAGSPGSGSVPAAGGGGGVPVAGPSGSTAPEAPAAASAVPVAGAGPTANPAVPVPDAPVPTPTPAPTPPPAPRTVKAVLPGETAGVPVLMYHYIRDNPNPADQLGFRLSVRPADFASELDLLQFAGYHTVTPQAVYDALAGRAPLPPHPICLSFDDGYGDFATTAVPLLRAHGFTAVDYVVSGFMGRPGYMTADQVRSLPGAGMTVGAHTVHHLGLDQIPPQLAAYEITQSRHDLEGLLGRPVTDFAYPSGRYNATVEAFAGQAGFHGAVTTVEGVATRGSDLLALHRVRIGGGQNLDVFAARLGIRVVDVPAPEPPPPAAAPSPTPAPPPAPTPAPPSAEAATAEVRRLESLLVAAATSGPVAPPTASPIHELVAMGTTLYGVEPAEAAPSAPQGDGVRHGPGAGPR